MPDILDFQARLETYLCDALHAAVRVVELRRLPGGASQESWAVKLQIDSGPLAGLQSLVLRKDMGGRIQEQALSREHEFRVLERAKRASVLVPTPRWLCTNPSVLGAPFFLMDWLEGETVGRRIVREPALAQARRLLPEQAGTQLALIHRFNLNDQELPFLPGRQSPASPALDAIEETERQLGRFQEPHPALELALRWLRANVPHCSESVLVHGDFRLGNWMVGPEGLRGILDWEFAHIGNPAEDLAWPCVRSWRFGADSLRFAGIGLPEDFFQAYERAAGRHIDRSAIDYWEILGNLRWAVGCMAQADRHLSGQAPSLELASLGRRTAEMELETLDLIQRKLK